MRKGITPVIAMILLILIVVALGGVFAAWTTRTWETLGERGEEQIETVTEQLQKSIAIDAIDCTNGDIYVRNMGNQDIAQAEISVYLDDAKDDIVSCTTCPITSGVVATLDMTTAGPWASGTKVKVTVSGNSATDKCD
jgi:flagellin-like protein